jgi:hypothetical protein
MKRNRASDKPRAQLKLFTELRRLHPRDYSWADLRYFRQKLERALRQERGLKR